MGARRIFIIALVLLIFTSVPVMGDQAADKSSNNKTARWESDLSVGAVLHKRIGIVKSFWWYPLPEIIALGLSFDFVGSIMPLSLNVSLNLPLPVIVPFVCAGAGTSLTRGGIANIGGGLKFRFWPKIGIIVEYRKYFLKPDLSLEGPGATKARRDYIGAGITYIY